MQISFLSGNSEYELSNDYNDYDLVYRDLDGVNAQFQLLDGEVFSFLIFLLTTESHMKRQ